MSVRITAKPINPDDIEVELTLKMRLGELKSLKRQLVSEYPSWRFTNAIATVVAEMERGHQSLVEEEM